MGKLSTREARQFGQSHTVDQRQIWTHSPCHLYISCLGREWNLAERILLSLSCPSSPKRRQASLGWRKQTPESGSDAAPRADPERRKRCLQGAPGGPGRGHPLAPFHAFPKNVSNVLWHVAQAFRRPHGEFGS